MKNEQQIQEYKEKLQAKLDKVQSEFRHLNQYEMQGGSGQSMYAHISTLEGMICALEWCREK